MKALWKIVLRVTGRDDGLNAMRAIAAMDAALVASYEGDAK